MAVKAPKVETLAKSMAMLDPGYSEQRGLIEEQIEGLGAMSDVRRQRLEGARASAYDEIRDAANAMGVAFGGFTPEEQNRYLAGTFLPGMQEIELQEGQERMQLRGTLADLNTQQRNMAISRIDQQTQALNNWNLQQAQLEAQRRENELNRKFQTSERLATQQFTASQNAANRAAQAAQAAASQGLSSSQAGSIIDNLVRGHKGRDGYVSPSAYQSLVSDAYARGIDPASYATLMQKYVNPKHSQDYTLRK